MEKCLLPNAFILKARSPLFWFPAVRRSLDTYWEINQTSRPIFMVAMVDSLKSRPKKVCPALWPRLYCTWLAGANVVSMLRWFYWTIPSPVKNVNSNRLPAFVRLSSLSCIYLTCFSINSDNKTTLPVDLYFSPTERWTHRGVDVQRQPPWWTTAWRWAAPSRPES